jgi:hypothetical protein
MDLILVQPDNDLKQNNNRNTAIFFVNTIRNKIIRMFLWITANYKISTDTGMYYL